jgi:hypothetical protein
MTIIKPLKIYSIKLKKENTFVSPSASLFIILPTSTAATTGDAPSPSSSSSIQFIIIAINSIFSHQWISGYS